VHWRYRHTVLTLCTLAFASTMVARLVISPLVPDIAAGLSISTGEIGLALTGMWGAYALIQFPSGVFGDRFGERRVILAALSLTAAASVLLAFATSFATFALFTVLLGLAAGLHYTVATTFLTKQFDEIGRAIGVHIAGGPLAGLVAPVAAVAIGARYGWRVGLLLGAAVGLPILVLFAWQVRETPPTYPDRAMAERFELAPLTELLSRPPIAYTTGLAICGAFTWQATASFLPAFLIEYRGFSQAFAGVLFSAYFVIHGATQPLTGWLSDRFGRDAAASLTMGLGVLGYSSLVLGSGLPSAMLSVGVIGLAMSWGAPVQSRFMDVLGDAERGAGFGLVRTVYMLVGASGSAVVGLLAENVAWSVAFAFLSGLMAVGFLAVVSSRVFDLDV